MIQNTRFTNNWNGKLGCKCFTTLRLLNPKKYALGSEHDIWLNTKLLGRARVIDHEETRLSWLKEREALLDTGYSVAHTRVIITRMYRKAETEDLKMSFVTFIFTDRKEMP